MKLNWNLVILLFLPKVILADLVLSESKNTSGKNPETIVLSSFLSRKLLDVRPSSCPKCDDATVVNVSLHIIQILGFKESEEVLKMSGWFTFIWRDYRLQWNTTEYENLTCLNLPSFAKVWKPDIGLINNVDMSLFDLSSTSKPRLRVYPDGVITWLQGVVVEVTCPLDVSSLPFDTQECHIIVTPWQSDIDQVVIVPHQIGSAVQNQYFPNSNISEWTITGMKHQNLDYRSPDGIDFQFIKFSIIMRRQPLYFVVMVILPFGLLSFLACLIFTLKGASDRLSVALSILLSMTMYVAIMSSNTPRSMRSLPVICIYCLCQLIILSGSIIWAVFTSDMFHCHLGKIQWPIVTLGCRSKQKTFPNKNRKMEMSKMSVLGKGVRSDSFESFGNNGAGDMETLEQTDSMINMSSLGTSCTKENIQTILDVIGFCLYITFSILNGIVCFIILP